MRFSGFSPDLPVMEITNVAIERVRDFTGTHFSV